MGAAALLIWGLRLIKTGMLRAYGTTLRHWIGRMASNPLSAAFAGMFATLAVQSSTATAVITASFAARELITAQLAQAIMLGANVGTAIVAAVLSLDLHFVSPLLIFAGVAIFTRARFARGKGIGRAVLGLGLMLLSLDLLGQATEPVRQSEAVVFILASLTDAPVLGLLFATGLAFLASSSLAVVLFVVLLGQAGIIAPTLALVLVAGANLGGAIPPYLAVIGEGVEAQRLALTNLAIRAVGALVLMIGAPWLALWLAPLAPQTGILALYAHVGFSLVLLAVFLPLLGPLVTLVERLMPSAHKPPFGPRYLEDKHLATPSIAIAAAARETLRLGDMISELLESSLLALRTGDPGVLDALKKRENEIDALHRDIKIYLARLEPEQIHEDDMQRVGEVIAYAINLEHIGDIVDSGLADLAAKRAKRKLTFSSEGLAEITGFYERTLDILQMAQSVFLSRDPELARDLAGCKAEVRKLESASAEKHLARLRAGRPETVETSGLHLDILRDLKRVNAHLISVAYPILDDMGALRDTRVRPMD